MILNCQDIDETHNAGHLSAWWLSGDVVYDIFKRLQLWLKWFGLRV